MHDDTAWWAERLTPAAAEAGPPLLRQRSKVYSAKRAQARVAVPAGLTGELRRRAGAAPADVLLAGLAGVLHRYTAQNRIALARAAPRGPAAAEPLVVVVAAGAEDTFAGLVARAAAAREASARRRQPLPEIAAALGLAEVQNRHPLFTVALRIAALDAPLDAGLRHDVTVELTGSLAESPGAAAPVRSAPAPTHAAAPAAGAEAARAGGSAAPGELALEIDYSARLYEPEVIERFGGHLLLLLAGGLAAPETPLRELPLLGDAERAQLLGAFAGGAVDWSERRTVCELFAEQAARTPDAAAIVSATGTITYRELDGRANRLAHQLRALGAGRGQAVGLCMAAGAELLVALLGILRSGAAVVPLVPGFPARRNALVVEDAGLRWVVTETALRGRLPAACAALCCDAPGEAPTGRPADAPGGAAGAPGTVGASDLAYILFTSGSTGRPKGVAMPHCVLTNLVAWQRARGGDPAGTRTLQRTSIGFDVSFQEIFSTLCHGGTLVVVPDAARDDVSKLPALIDRHAVRRVFLPPVALHQLAAAAATQRVSLASLREVIVAGEALQVSMPVVRLFREIDCTLDNQYGPTETHVVSAHLLSGPSTRWPALPPIGRPIHNARLYVLDAWLQPVPLGVAGEICVGGLPLARGYVGRDGCGTQGAAAFVPDPFADTPSSPGARLYRTGDMGRFLLDSSIEFLGRRDHQVKIRGYRIELGEIEAVLRQLPGIGEAAVAVHDDPARGRFLAAYVCGAPGGAPPPDAATIRAFLLDRLPGHMVPGPAAILRLDALPLTGSGKIDRRALPVPARHAREAPDGEPEGAARSAAERQVAAIWEKVLGVSGVGRHESFLDLGGHSLLGIQIISHLHDLFGFRLPLAMFLRGTTVAQAAARIEELRGGGASAAGGPPGGAGRRFDEVQSLALPGGRRLYCLHRAEAAYLYVDVFEHRTYDRAGIRYPPEGTVFDVGANIGLFTLYARERARGLRIHAFEPAPPLFEVLRRNTAGLGGIEIAACALSDRTGRGRLTYYPALSGMSSLYPDLEQERALLGTILRNLSQGAQGAGATPDLVPFARELVDDRLASTVFDCELRPLSQVIAERGVERIDLLKIDVQKAEMDVLRGIADGDWPRIRQVAAEVHDLDRRVERVAALLRDRGFRVQVEQDALHRGSVVHFVYATRG